MEEFNYLYIKPYCRIHPYLVGLVVGYLVHKRMFRAKQLNWVSNYCRSLGKLFRTDRNY
jgi:hypothetical protein